VSDEKIIKLCSREEMLAAVLTVEWHGISRAGDKVFGPVVYRFATEEDRDNFGKAEASVLGITRKP
jgi:hypothetical protein